MPAARCRRPDRPIASVPGRFRAARIPIDLVQQLKERGQSVTFRDVPDDARVVGEAVFNDHLWVILEHRHFRLLRTGEALPQCCSRLLPAPLEVP